MADFETVEKRIEDEIVKRLDPYEVATRITGWVCAAFQLIYAVMLASSGALVAAVLCATTALVLAFVLIKSRAVVTIAPLP